MYTRDDLEKGVLRLVEDEYILVDVLKCWECSYNYDCLDMQCNSYESRKFKFAELKWVTRVRK